MKRIKIKGTNLTGYSMAGAFLNKHRPGELAQGAVVLALFPNSDLSKPKIRPAVILSAVGNDDYLLCQITTCKKWPDLVEIETIEGGLNHTSYARPEKLFTGHKSTILGRVGLLALKPLKQIGTVASTYLKGV